MGSYNYNASSSLLPVFLTAMLVALSPIMVAGQGSGQVGTCATNLQGCFTSLNSTTTPPSTCCGPLKDAVTNQKACLCGLYSNPDLLKSFGVNVTQALDLPVRCKIHTDSDANNFCKDVTPSGSPPSGSSGSTASPSGGKSTGTGSGSGSNSAVTIAGTGFISSFLMVITYVMLY